MAHDASGNKNLVSSTGVTAKIFNYGEGTNTPVTLEFRDQASEIEIKGTVILEEGRFAFDIGDGNTTSFTSVMLSTSLKNFPTPVLSCPKLLTLASKC